MLAGIGIGFCLSLLCKKSDTSTRKVHADTKPEKVVVTEEIDSSRAKELSSRNEVNLSATLNTDMVPYRKVRHNSQMDIEIGEEDIDSIVELNAGKSEQGTFVPLNLNPKKARSGKHSASSSVHLPSSRMSISKEPTPFDVHRVSIDN